MRRNSEDDFHAGLEALRPFFTDWDYELKIHPPHHAEDGVYHSAQFIWGSHAVTLIHHFGLGPVTYTVGAMTVEHTAYLEALGVRVDSAFPVSDDDDPVAGYHALLSDLESRLMPYFEEPDREFMEVAATYGHRGRPQLSEF